MTQGVGRAMVETEQMTGRSDSFSNEQIQLDDLPDYRSVELTPVASGYLTWALITQVSFWLVLAAGLGLIPFLPFSNIDWPWWNTLPAVSLLLGAVTAAYIVMDVRIRAWALREHDLIYRYGLFWRKTVILPFSRIQHVETAQGPLERHFDLMRLKCFTAGGLSADLVVRGLDSAAARRVRGFLLEQIADSSEASDASGAVEGDEPIERP